MRLNLAIPAAPARADSDAVIVGFIGGMIAGAIAAEGDKNRKTATCLTWPKPVLDQGRRLAASYANFLIINGAVLMPAYGDPMDDNAADVMALAFPGRQIIQIPCRSLIWQNGSLHYITIQLPEGLVS